MTRDEQIDLIYDALMYLGRIECDCHRVVVPSRSISRADVAEWLDNRHVKEVKEIAEPYMPAESQAELPADTGQQMSEIKIVCPTCGAVDDLVQRTVYVGGQGNEVVTECQDWFGCWQRWRTQYKEVKEQ